MIVETVVSAAKSTARHGTQEFCQSQILTVFH